VSVVQKHVRNRQFKLLDLYFHPSNHLYLQVLPNHDLKPRLRIRIHPSNHLCLRILLPNHDLKPQLRPLPSNLRASYLRTNGTGYKTLIEPWKIYG
jgi:hypothetical protein